MPLLLPLMLAFVLLFLVGFGGGGGAFGIVPGRVIVFDLRNATEVLIGLPVVESGAGNTPEVFCLCIFSA